MEKWAHMGCRVEGQMEFLESFSSSVSHPRFPVCRIRSSRFVDRRQAPAVFPTFRYGIFGRRRSFWRDGGLWIDILALDDRSFFCVIAATWAPGRETGKRTGKRERRFVYDWATTGQNY